MQRLIYFTLHVKRKVSHLFFQFIFTAVFLVTPYPNTDILGTGIITINIIWIFILHKDTTLHSLHCIYEQIIQLI